MKLERLILFFSSDPSAKLLKADSAPYVIYFLNQTYKVESNLSLPQSDLQSRLTRFLENLHETEPDVLCDVAQNYLTKWSTGDTRWLRRNFDSQFDEPVYELTPHTEDVFKFLMEALDRSLGFVGTESRLTRIIETLSDIVVRGSSDPVRRLDFLENEKARIENEIKSIQLGHKVETHSPTALRERFSDVVSDLISLQGDFRAVEESFKTITRDVQKRQNESGDERGSILGFALEAEDELNDGDQGTSFRAFVRLLLSQNQQDELDSMIRQLDDIGELANQLDGKQRIKRMIASLSAEAEKVQRTTRRLSSTLRRLLDQRTNSSRMHLANVLRKIQAGAVRASDNPPNIGIELPGDVSISNFMDRPMWTAPVQFETSEISSAEPDDDERMLAFRQLAELQRLDWDSMRTNIHEMRELLPEFTLGQLVEQFPIESGAVEALGYIQLAHDAGFEVDDTSTEVIHVCSSDDDQGTFIEIPLVHFQDKSQTKEEAFTNE